MTASRDAAHFRRLYQTNPDPWAFNTSPYEQAKYRQTLDGLGIAASPPGWRLAARSAF